MTKRYYRKYKLLRFYQEDLWGHMTVNFLEALRRLRINRNSLDASSKDFNSLDSFLNLKSLKINNFFFNDLVLGFLNDKKDKIARETAKFLSFSDYMKKSFAYRADIGYPMRKNKRLNLFSMRLRNRHKMKGLCSSINTKQFSKLYVNASHKDSFFSFFFFNLETRLDMFLYRLNFGLKSSELRQKVNHGFFLVNGKVVNVPSINLTFFDILSVKDKSYFFDLILYSFDRNKIMFSIPEYIEVNFRIMSAIIYRTPLVSEVPFSFFINFFFNKSRNSFFYFNSLLNKRKLPLFGKWFKK